MTGAGDVYDAMMFSFWLSGFCSSTQIIWHTDFGHELISSLFTHTSIEVAI